MIVARGNRESEGLAKYYCRERGVPAANLCEVDVPSTEAMEREHWRWAVRPEIQKWLKENDPDRKIRCLVTTWGVPLKVKPAKPDEAAARYLAHLQGERAGRIEKLNEVAAELDKLGADPSQDGGASALLEGMGGGDSLKQLEQRLEASLQAAQARLAGQTGEAGVADKTKLQQLAALTAGAGVLLQSMGQQLQQLAQGDQTPPLQAVQQFNLLRGRASGFAEIKTLLDQRAPSYERDELALTVVQQNTGLLGAVKWLDEAISTAEKNETGSSLDSELSLIYWPEDYQLLRWQPNYLRTTFDGSQLRETFPTMMVARLDGPDLKTAKRLIDDAIAVEKAGGLQGKAYFDARGLAEREGPPLETGSYPDYDRALLVTAEGMKTVTNEAGEPRFEVVLNEAPELFGPGDCPDAALYCGWYSLGKYVDAFDWRKGAVAYHLASAEARTLHEENAKTWCKSLLEDGVCATVGPVYEPYLVAFPRPNEFFALLTKSDLTLVEVYYRTKPFNSWMMVLVGDPLYQAQPPR
ncbi:TIGR03790 family protein [Posidoniimonas corsicana]|uniref:TIGR03790 family protein n=1 Tax=Posidoniimonas corsicana TaxID=1938618 RepID=UPI0018D3E81F|nr:TIGR03790 family protein [Posidoniimonas corsicana]